MSLPENRVFQVEYVMPRSTKVRNGYVDVTAADGKVVLELEWEQLNPIEFGCENGRIVMTREQSLRLIELLAVKTRKLDN